MQVNEARWGAQSTWVDYNASGEIKRPSNAKASYDLAYGLDTSTPDETMHTAIDLSIAPWGINKNSLLNKRYYVAPWYDSTQPTVEEQMPFELQAVNDEELEKTKPLIINGRMRMRNSQGGTFSPDSIMGNSTLVNDYNPNYPQFSSVTTYTNWAFNNVIVNFNYHKIVLMPCIMCSTGNTINDTNVFNTLSYSYYTFDQFLSMYDSDIKGKKVVKGLFWLEYLGNNGARALNNDEYSMQFTIPYHVTKRPSISGMPDDNKRYPKVDIDTMVSTCPTSLNQYQRCGFIYIPVTEWVWWYTATTPDRAINFYSGSNTNGNNYENRTWLYDDTIYDFYKGVMSQDYYRQVIPVIRTENRTAQEIVDYFARQMAYLGFMFAWNETDAQSAIIGENNSICIPTFDGGVTTGNYTRGTENINNPAFLWRDDVWDKNNYDPYNKGEEDFGDLTNKTANRLGTQGTSKFVGGASMINNLLSFLNGTYLPDNPAFIADFKGSNPQDYIVSVQKYPFSIPHTSTTTEIVIGSIASGINAAHLYSGTGIMYINSDCTFDFGEISIPRYYNDFRDYLSKISLLMPFVGSVDLDPKLYIGHTLGLIYIIDFDTGSVAAQIKRDGLTMETKTSTISITIPFFAANMGAFQNALAQTGFSIEQSKIKQIAGIMSTALSVGGTLATGGAASDTARLGMAGGLVGGVTSMISGQVQQQALQYELEHTAPQIGTISVAAAANAFFLDDRARVLIVRPKMLPDYDPELYSHTVGNACAVPGTLSSFSGYTVAGAAELSSITARDGSGVSPTAEELRMIKQALQSGIYV